MIFEYYAKSKRETLDAVRYVASIVGFFPKVLRSDQGTEIDNSEIREFCLNNDWPIRQEHSVAFNQSQNALVEASVHRIFSKVRVLMFQSGLGIDFWPFAFSYAVVLLNHLPHSSLGGKIPIIEHGGKPYPHLLYPFGCSAVRHLGKERAADAHFAARGQSAIFVGVGINSGTKAPLLYVFDTQTVEPDCNAVFDTTFYPARKYDQRLTMHSSEQFYDAVPTTDPNGLVIDHDLPDPLLSSQLLEYDVLTDASSTGAVCGSTTTGASSTGALSELSSSTGAGSSSSSALPCRRSARVVPNSTVSQHQTGDGDAQNGDAQTVKSVRSVRRNPRSVHFGPDIQANSDTAVDVSDSRNSTTMRELDPNHNVLYKWQLVGRKSIQDVSDKELSEFCIGENVVFAFEPYTWHGDPNVYLGAVVDTRNDARGLKVKLVIWKDEQGSKNEQFWYFVTQPETGTKQQIVLRDVLIKSNPTMTCLWDMTKRVPKKKQIPIKMHKIKGKFSKAFVAASASVSPFFAFTVMHILNAVSSSDSVELNMLPPEPRNYRDKLKRPDRELWDASEKVEFDTLVNHDTWEVVDVPTDVPLLPTQWVYKLKLSHNGPPRYKSRVVCRGDLQLPEEYDSLFSPTARIATCRTLLSIANQNDYDLFGFDIQAAFVSAPIDRTIYIQLPPGYELPKGKAARLKKSLYGLRQAPALFAYTLRDWMLQYGFVPVGDDDTLYRYEKDGEVLIVSMYVDDGLACSNSSARYEHFLNALQQRFTISNAGPLTEYLGMRIQRDRANGWIMLDQQKYCEELLQRFGMSECSPDVLPFRSHTYLSGDDCRDPVTADDRKVVKQYQQMVGALLWLSNSTRPDISFAVNQCARFLANPGDTHLAAAKQILRYLKGTSNLGIRYQKQSDRSSNYLWGYVDSDHGGNPDDRRSVTGFVLYFNGGPITWSSKRQPVVAVSSSEAEFYAASLAGLEVQYFRRLLEELGFPQLSPTPLLEDNQACIYMSQSAGQMKRAKHIDTRVHRLREQVRDGDLQLLKVKTDNQVADFFTKGLSKEAFRRHRSYLVHSRV
jgi:hypothetical protein